MAENPGLDLKALGQQIDFNQLGKTLGVPELSLAEMGKGAQLQMEYTQKMWDLMYEMNAQFFIRWFGKEAFKDLLKKHFPKGREYYQIEIEKGNKLFEDMQNQLMLKMAEAQTAPQNPPIVPALPPPDAGTENKTPAPGPAQPIKS